MTSIIFKLSSEIPKDSLHLIREHYTQQAQLKADYGSYSRTLRLREYSFPGALKTSRIENPLQFWINWAVK